MTTPTSPYPGALAGLAPKLFATLVLAALPPVAALPSPAAAEPVRHHALSLVGKPKFAADFKHFDWVNPDAPKGGSVRQADMAPSTASTASAFRVTPPTGSA